MSDAANERQVNGMLCISAKTAQDSISATQEAQEPYYSRVKQTFRYIESFFICAPCLVFVFFYLIAAYNITGVIKENSKYKDFVITFLADLAAPGAIFDADSNAAWITTIG